MPTRSRPTNGRSMLSFAIWRFLAKQPIDSPKTNVPRAQGCHGTTCVGFGTRSRTSTSASIPRSSGKRRQRIFLHSSHRSRSFSSSSRPTRRRLDGDPVPARKRPRVGALSLWWRRRESTPVPKAPSAEVRPHAFPFPRTLPHKAHVGWPSDPGAQGGGIEPKARRRRGRRRMRRKTQTRTMTARPSKARPWGEPKASRTSIKGKGPGKRSFLGPLPLVEAPGIEPGSPTVR